MATTTKKPSAAELARREAQSKADTGVPEPVEVGVFGQTVTVDPDVFKRLDMLDDMMTLEDEDADDNEKAKALIRALRALCGPNYRKVFSAAGGIENAQVILTTIQEAVNPS